MNKKVTGIGGIFFKTESPDKMKAWYSKNLGLVTDEFGSPFEFIIEVVKPILGPNSHVFAS